MMWTVGLKLEVEEISKHLRKPKKARMNMALPVRGGVNGVVALPRVEMNFVNISKAIGCLASGQVGWAL